MNTDRSTGRFLERCETTWLKWLNGHEPDDHRLGVRRRFHVPRVHCWWLLLYCLLLGIQVSPWWYVTRDGGIYLLVSRQLVHGDVDIPPGSIGSVVPPGYPLIVSPAFLLGDRPFLAISILHWLLGIALVWGVYFWSRTLDPPAAVLVTGLAALNAGLCYYYRRTLKEVAFVAMVVWLVLLLHRLRETRSVAWQYAFSAGCGLLLYAIALTRYSGILFAAGFGIILLIDAWRRRSSWTRAIVLTLCVGVPAAAGVLGELYQQRQQFLVHGGVNYERAFQHAATQPTEQVANGAASWISSVTRVTIPGMLKTDFRSWWDPNMVLFVAVLLFSIWGWWRLLRRRLDVWAVTLPLYIVLYLAWPFDQGARFAIPLIPILVACHWMALVSLQKYVRFPVTIASGILLLQLGVSLVYWATLDAPRARTAHQWWEVVDELTCEVDEGNVQTWNVPSPVYVMSQHALKRLIRNSSSDQCVLFPETDWLIRPVSENPVPGFEQRKRVGDYAVFRRLQYASIPLVLQSADAPGDSVTR